MEPQIRFCTSADGTRIAYATYGEGPPLVYVPYWDANLELQWKRPDVRPFIESLSRGHLYVQFDRRGFGASQREVDDLSLAAHVADLATVVDHLEQERVYLLGSHDGAAVSVAYAAQYPERVSRLVLWAPYPWGQDVTKPEAIRGLAELIRGNWSLARRAIGDINYPAGPIEAQRRFSDTLRESVSPEIAARYIEFWGGVDVRPYLPQVQAPTLVLHRRGDRHVTKAAATAVAALIPDARFVALEGTSPVRSQDDTEPVLAAIDEFLGEAEEAAAKAELPEGMAVILFADIVGSTALTEEMGDAAFRGKARDLDTSLRAVIRETGGTPVEGKLVGDGVLAVFTSARQAIECALRCGAAGDSVDLRLHLGIHAGDVIREENNVYGGAVNIAARIAGASAPGEVLVSDTVRGLARTSAGVGFEDRGEHELKGIAEPQRLFEVRAREGA